MSLFEQLKSKYGDNIGRGAEFEVFAGVIPTGIIALDNATGVGGIPLNKVTQIYGKESSGKSTVALHVVSMAQSMGLEVVYIDAEGSFDREYASALGVDAESVILFRPETAEDTLLAGKDSIQAGAGLVIVDSVPALPTRYESDGEIGDAHVGQTARLLSQASRMWTPLLNKNDAAVLAINQIRAAISARGPAPQQYPGGHQWKHRIDLNVKLSSFKPTDKTRLIKFNVEKNKLGKPGIDGDFTIIHGFGVDLGQQIIDAGIKLKILKKAGSWVKYGDETLGQGVNAIDAIAANNDLCIEILQSALEYPTDEILQRYIDRL